LQSIVALLFIANTINIGADLSAMADATRLLIGGPNIFYVVVFASICVGGIVLVQYERYALILKWMTLSLFSYVAVFFAVRVPRSEALSGLLVPRITWSAEFFTTLVAIFGTTISPYLFFWQASQEVEEVHANHMRKPLLRAPRQALDAFSRIRADTMFGMAISNIIALAIIFATAATLHKGGITNIESSAQAAEALRPIAGDFAFALFALGSWASTITMAACVMGMLVGLFV
jgi:Mn2+/Fe2+ NRAMP family transporter